MFSMLPEAFLSENSIKMCGFSATREHAGFLSEPSQVHVFEFTGT